MTTVNAINPVMQKLESMLKEKEDKTIFRPEFIISNTISYDEWIITADGILSAIDKNSNAVKEEVFQFYMKNYDSVLSPLVKFLSYFYILERFVENSNINNLRTKKNKETGKEVDWAVELFEMMNSLSEEELFEASTFNLESINQFMEKKIQGFDSLKNRLRSIIKKFHEVRSLSTGNAMIIMDVVYIYYSSLVAPFIKTRKFENEDDHELY